MTNFEKYIDDIIIYGTIRVYQQHNQNGGWVEYGNDCAMEKFVEDIKLWLLADCAG